MNGEGRELRTVADMDAEIARLEAARDDYKRQLSDPVQRENRRIRRQQLLGRAAETWKLPAKLVDEARPLAGDEAWLFDPEYMQPDGWTLEEGQWTFAEPSRSG